MNFKKSPFFSASFLKKKTSVVDGVPAGIRAFLAASRREIYKRQAEVGIEVWRQLTNQPTNVTQPTQLTTNYQPNNQPNQLRPNYQPTQPNPTNSDPTQLTTKPTQTLRFGGEKSNPKGPGTTCPPPTLVIRDFLEPKQHYHGACKHGLRSPSPDKFSRNV